MLVSGIGIALFFIFRSVILDLRFGGKEMKAKYFKKLSSGLAVFMGVLGRAALIQADPLKLEVYDPPVSELKKEVMLLYMEDKGIDTKKMPDPFPITSKAKNIMLVVAGGAHPTHAYWMQAAQGPKTVIKKIQLPTNWATLLKEAEEELGPSPND